jgi:hypothetical protein
MTSIEKLTNQLDQQRRKVDFDTYDISVEQLISMVRSGAIDVAPVYQRQFRWDNLKRSHLIESLFLGVPVPSLFMATNKDATWELVDGVQRISTVIQFAGDDSVRRKLAIAKPLVLEELDKLNEFNGLSFSDLPDSLRLLFLHRPLKVITLSDKSDLVVRFDLFERLNTGGVALTNQEIRGCIYRGPFNEFLENLAETEDFHTVVRLTQRQQNDGTREECVLRFFAFFHRYKTFVHSVVDFLNTYMQDADKSFKYKEGETLFLGTFKELSSALPHGIVRDRGRTITPINLFEAVAVGAALALKKTGHLKTKGIQNWIMSDKLRKLTTGATNNRAMVVGRIQYCRNKFLGK